MIRGFSKKKRILTIASLAFVGVMASAISIGKANAAYVGYFNTYKYVANIELDSNFTSAQAMNIYNSVAFHIKTANNGTARAGYSRIWAYDLTNNTNNPVYNKDTGGVEFQIGHGNCMYVGDGSLYIATQETGKPSIVKYNYSNENGTYYLSNRKEFSVYSHNQSIKQPIAITGINYASELGGFLVKNGLDVYLGNFTNDTFQWTKHYILDTNLTVQTNNGIENIDVKNYIRQGMFYRSGILYMPMTNNNQKNQSIVVAYYLNQNTANEAVIPEIQNQFFRITSSKYSKLFEIEDVARHNNQMYVNVNTTDASGRNYDRIIKFNDFTY
ncbi:MAG: hypothetical protein E7262_08850 [Lachnospiraceae bacterium]|nr:hypothetical protein [Lachnospiraceae bacterium]